MTYLPRVAPALLAALLLCSCAAPNPPEAQTEIARPAAAAPAATAPPRTAGDGLVRFEKARQDEIAAAAQTQREVVAVLSTLPRRPVAAAAGELKTVEVIANDAAFKESRKLQAFESVTVDIPIAAKGTPQYEQAIGKIKTLVERVADERGSCRVDITMTAADARARRVRLETATAKTSKGHPVTVSKTADNAVPRGVERFTVRAGPLQTDL